MGKIVGIDLGTSNSAAAVMVGGKPTIIQAAEGTSRRQGVPLSGSIYQGWATHRWRASSPSDDFEPRRNRHCGKAKDGNRF